MTQTFDVVVAFVVLDEFEKKKTLLFSPKWQDPGRPLEGAIVAVSLLWWRIWFCLAAIDQV